MKGNKNRVSGRTNSLHLLCHTLPLLCLAKFPFKLPLLVGTFQKCETLVCSNQSLLLAALSHVQTSRMKGTAASFILLWADSKQVVGASEVPSHSHIRVLQVVT